MQRVRGTAMRLGDLSHHRKSKTGAFRAPGDKWFEQLIAHEFGYSMSGIGDG